MFTRSDVAARSELSIEVASSDFDNAAMPQKRNEDSSTMRTPSFPLDFHATKSLNDLARFRNGIRL
jgi:hypothetical protein